MTVDPNQLLAEALKLPAEARAALAGSLIESLDAEPDADVEAAWAVEIARRQADLSTGRVSAVPWAEARRRILGA